MTHTTVTSPAASFGGTVSDGGGRSVGGELVLDEEVRRLFDYHLAAVGELPLAQIVAGLEADLDQRLPAKAAAAAKQLLKRYLAFKTALQQLEQDPKLAGDGLSALQARLAMVRKLRSQYFNTAETAALFGWQDRYDDDALARQAISRDGALSASDKAQRLAALDRQLPPEILTLRQAPVQHLALADSVTAARAKGADDAAIFRLREANVGAAAATRLAAVDKEETEWQQRISRYLAALAEIRGNSNLSELQRQAAIDTLRQTQFDASERLRLSAYEQ
ncbi:lipase secretion chaperone [Chitinimonas naiadis]